MSEIRDNREAQQFELEVDGVTAVAAYIRRPDAVVFTHTEVPAALRGQGVGERLVKGALAAVRAEGLRVVPQCPFVAKYVKKHPEEADV